VAIAGAIVGGEAERDRRAHGERAIDGARAFRAPAEAHDRDPGRVNHSDSECVRAGSAWRSDLRLK
jgi:hypothetical protein